MDSQFLIHQYKLFYEELVGEDREIHHCLQMRGLILMQFYERLEIRAQQFFELQPLPKKEQKIIAFCSPSLSLALSLLHFAVSFTAAKFRK